MTTTASMPPKITCSKYRLADVIRRLNTKGYHTLNEADRLVLSAHAAETLTVIGNEQGMFVQFFTE